MKKESVSCTSQPGDWLGGTVRGHAAGMSMQMATLGSSRHDTIKTKVANHGIFCRN